VSFVMKTETQVSKNKVFKTQVPIKYLTLKKMTKMI
jgi:hypothetical protein